MNISVLAARSRLRCCGLALVIGALTQGCAASRGPPARPTTPAAEDRATPDLPPGATEIGDQLYLVPIGADEDGCPMYRLYSPTKLVAQAIYYRNAAGGFTTNREDADCASGTPN